MAPKKKQGMKGKLKEFRTKFLSVDFIKSLLFDPSQLSFLTYLIIVAELILNIFIVNRVSYTEIDWVAYMQECEGFLNGTTDYSQLKGNFKLIF
jgi:alpha-1,3-mannosyltransferase